MSQPVFNNPLKVSQKMEWERHEAKYIVSPTQVHEIRKFLEPFCVRDPNGEGLHPIYTVTTLQLDDADLSLYKMKEDEALNRFKLRIRSYGEKDTGGKVFFENKRKIKGVIVKSRATVVSGEYGAHLFNGDSRPITFARDSERAGFYDWLRLKNEIGAIPRILIRYERESYFGLNDSYARVTFDRAIRYRPTRGWSLWPEGGRWWSIDSEMALNRTFPGIILELKTYDEAPIWMIDLIERFNLVRVGFCKYHAAVRMESLFTGGAFAGGSETTYTR